jgi:alpha-galactosidase
VPGIWIGPFMVGNRSRLWKEHPDWILHNNDGTPVTNWRFYTENKVWGYLDEEFYTLDTSHPEALEYLRTVFRTFRRYGVGLYKTDFMFWGIEDSTKVKRHTPGKTSFEYFRDTLKAIREEIGEDSYWLGCIAPFLPFVGFADGMRIAGDVGAQWNGEQFGPENMIQEIVGDNYLNWIYWQNDPDAMLLRNFHTALTDEETESLVLLQAVSGGMMYTSDPVHEMSEERKALLRFVMPKNKVKPELPFLQDPRKEIVMVHQWEQEGKALVFVFNPTEETVVEHYSLRQLTGQEAAYVREWKTGECNEDKVRDLLVRIPAHGCKLYFVCSADKPKQKIDNLWNW